MIEWVEIPTTDFARGAEFYNRVFQLSMEALDFGTEKMACFPTGEGAVFFKPGFEPSENGMVVSFRVPDSIEKTLQRITESGGRILIPRTKIEAEGRGYFALFTDSEGNKAGLYED